MIIIRPDFASPVKSGVFPKAHRSTGGRNTYETLDYKYKRVQSVWNCVTLLD